MDRDQPEWVQRFGARMRTERASFIDDPLPQVIIAKLQALADAEHQLVQKDSASAKK
jgi:hypothetical protein